MEVSAEELKKAVEGIHQCRATLSAVVPVVELLQGQIAWEGTVHVFDLEGHLAAMKCFAWSAQVDDSDRRRFYAVLQIPPINNASDAVRAAILRDFKSDHTT